MQISWAQAVQNFHQASWLVFVEKHLLSYYNKSKLKTLVDERTPQAHPLNKKAQRSRNREAFPLAMMIGRADIYQPLLMDPPGKLSPSDSVALVLLKVIFSKCCFVSSDFFSCF